MKLQIKIHVIGFGWKDLYHPWSKEGRAYTADELFGYLINTLIPEQNTEEFLILLLWICLPGNSLLNWAQEQQM